MIPKRKGLLLPCCALDSACIDPKKTFLFQVNLTITVQKTDFGIKQGYSAVLTAFNKKKPF